jgi:phage-related protein
VNGIHWNEGLSAFLKIHDGYEEEYWNCPWDRRNKFVLIYNHRTYNLPLNENWLPNLHPVTEVKPK